MISVIIKTKNSGDFLCETLESVSNADEIIVVDENSSDDTLDIARNYKANVIYVSSDDIKSGLNQAVNEAKNDWIMVLADNEIVPQKLFSEIIKYIENPKKNRFCLLINHKTFYLDEEMKFAHKKALRVFKKGYAEFKNSYSIGLKCTQGKTYNINKNNQNKNGCILKNQKPVLVNFKEILEKANFRLKNCTRNKTNFFKLFEKFISLYILKGAIFSGKIGIIYIVNTIIEDYLLECSIYERARKDDI